MKVLAIDIGGTHVKFRTPAQPSTCSFPSGPKMGPKAMVKAVLAETSSWKFDHVAIGYPGPVVHDKPLREPFNLGEGWVKFGWNTAFGGRPIRMLNDAAMQALGSYNGGRMLFLGLGTGLGSAMVVEGIVEPMELAHLPWKKGKTYEECLGLKALKRNGRKTWTKHVLSVIADLSQALESDYVVLGGGNAKLIEKLPKQVSLGSNENAILGGFAVWKDALNLKPSQGKRMARI